MKNYITLFLLSCACASGATITVQVTDTAGTPIPNASVQIVKRAGLQVPSPIARVPQLIPRTASAIAGLNGLATFIQAEPGDYVVCVTPPAGMALLSSCEWNFSPRLYTVGQTDLQFAIALRKGVQFEVRVSDPKRRVQSGVANLAVLPKGDYLYPSVRLPNGYMAPLRFVSREGDSVIYRTLMPEGTNGKLFVDSSVPVVGPQDESLQARVPTDLDASVGINPVTLRLRVE